MPGSSAEKAAIAIQPSGPASSARTAAADDQRRAERAWQLLRGPVLDVPLDRSIHDLFAAVAAAHPDRVALIDTGLDGDGASLIYRELADRVDGLAGRLARAGVGSGAIVAVLLERSSALIATLLAIWRLGGVYLPLDPGFPADYRRFILDDAEARFVIADGASAPLCPPDRTMIRVDAQDAALPPPASRFAPEAPCLLLYTSGSTGRPKGVVHCARQILNRLHWLWRTYPFAAGDIQAQRSPATVMPSIGDMLGALLAGVPTVVVADALVRDPARLMAALERRRVSLITLTPTLLRLMLDAGAAGAPWPGALRQVVIGGEPLGDPLYRRFRAVWPDCLLIDDFGATEVNTVLHRPLPPGHDGPVAEASSQPIANIAVCLLDDALQPVGPGQRGELCIAGPALALGYHRRPALDAERFVEVPFGAGPALRLYRTGDLGRWAADGGIIMAGRRDHLVKINGVGVELAEVEAALSGLDAVAEVAVVDAVTGESERFLAAFLTPRVRPAADLAEIRAVIAARLPAPLRPRRLVWLDALPRRPNGKIDRLALAARAAETGPAETPPPDDRLSVAQLVALAADLLGASGSSLDPSLSFAALGFDSVLLIGFAEKLSRRIGRTISPTRLYDHPSLEQLARALSADGAVEDTAAAPTAPRSEAAASDRTSSAATIDIAIIGMAGRFPGADTLDAFWRNLVDGVESLSAAADERWSAEALYDADPSRADRSVSRRVGFVPGADRFDPEFFGLSPADARAMDPQQRLALMTAWHALEDAGAADAALGREPVGVFVGARESDYGDRRRADAAGLIGNDQSLIAARIAYAFDLTGPALVVNTACSSSLVALHLAAHSLIDGDCALALAGGVAVTNDPRFLVATSRLGILSPQSRTRPFDADADGFVHGEGVGFVVLKRLAAAQAAGDRIHAVIRASGVNQDGRSNGLTAPKGEAQSALQQAVYRRAGIDPATITLVEAHGTATPLGDPIEVEALTRAFCASTARTGFCALGSVKGNIGHLTAAAGIAGLIKTVLCLKHRAWPPSLHFDRPNPRIDFAASPFFVNTEHRPWTVAPGAVRRAAINAFGIGGTNAHVVLDEAPAAAPDRGPDRAAYLVPITARTAAAVARAAAALLAWLNSQPEPVRLRDLSYTALVGRRRFDCGVAIVATGIDDLREHLSAIIAGQPRPDGWAFGPRAVATDDDGSAGMSAEDPAEAESSFATDGALPTAATAVLDRMRAHARRIARGEPFDGRALFAGETPRRLSTPLYPFEQQRYWHDEPAEPILVATDRIDAGSRAARADVGARTSGPPPVVTIAAAAVALLHTVVARLLGMAPAALPLDRPLGHYGYESIQALALQQDLARRGFEVALANLLGGASVNDIALCLTGEPGASAIAASRISNAEPRPSGADAATVPGVRDGSTAVNPDWAEAVPVRDAGAALLDRFLAGAITLEQASDAELDQLLIAMSQPAGARDAA